MKNKWEKLCSENVVDTKWLSVKKDTVRLPNGYVMDDYFVIEKKDVALIAAIDEEKRILVKEEYRYPVDETLTELPGGTFERGEEDPLEAAKRELLEETGYVSECWELLACNYDYPTKDTNRVYIYCARDIKKTGEQKLDISEDISYRLIPFSEAVEMCKQNQIKVNGSVTAILLVAMGI